MNASHKNITNWLLTHALWFACVLGGNIWALVAGSVYWMLYIFYIGDIKHEWRSLVVIAGSGFTVDTFLSSFGLITFNSNLPIALWMLVLWSGFATLFHHGLHWLHSKPLVAAAIGAIAGPASYFAGASLSTSVIGISLPIFIIIYALLWTFYMPLFLFVCRRFSTALSPEVTHI